MSPAPLYGKVAQPALLVRLGFFCRLVFLSTIVLSLQALAFESEEHRAVGNAAVIAALYAFQQQTDPGVPKEIRDAVVREVNAALEDPQDPRGPDYWYGALVSCVDDYLTPEALFAQITQVEPSQPERPSPLAPLIPSSREQLNKDIFQNHCGRSGIAAAYASHNNRTHFQREVLVSQAVYHSLALGLARNRGHVFSALVVSAVASHYLHDSFAPGHLSAPRDRLTDVFTVSIHDRTNVLGMEFRTNPSNLGPVLDAIAELSNRGWIDHQPKGYGDALDWEALSARFGRLMLASPFDPREGQRAPRAEPIPDRELQRLSATASHLKQAQTVQFRGDHMLWGREDLPQHVYIVAVNAKAVLEVLNSYVLYLCETDSNVCPRNSVRLDNSFEMGRFYWAMDGTRADTPYGSFRLGNGPKLAANTEEVAEVSSAHVSSEPDAPSIRESWFSSLAPKTVFSPIIGLSVSRESMSAGGRVGRNVITLEAALAGYIFSDVAVGAAAGYSYYNEGQVRGNGPVLRVGATIPSTDIIGSVYGRYLDYPSSGGDVRKFSYGLRVDMGFSLLGLFVAVGRDYGTTPELSLQQGWLWTGGVELQLPLSRVHRAFVQEPRAPVAERATPPKWTSPQWSKDSSSGP